MSDEQALLAAIWEHPHDDTVRLVYADWLQENGQPERAEFIRVQIELARFDQWDESPRKAELQKREQALWKKHGRTWRTGLPSPLKQGMFHRGFPRPAERFITGKEFVKFPAAPLKVAPLWTFNLGRTDASLVPKIARSAAFGRAEKFVLQMGIDGITADGVGELVGSPNARNLTTLGLSGLEVSDAGMRVFVQSARVPHLSALYVSDMGLTDEGIRTLDEWSGAERLQDLWLEENALTDAALEVIAAGPLGRGLKSLLIGGNPGVTTAGLIRLIESPVAGSLRLLDVAESAAVTPEFAEALAASPRSQALRQLILRRTPLGARGVVAILDSPYLQQLQNFDVRGCRPPFGEKVAGQLNARFGGAYGGGGGGWRVSPTT